MQKKIFSIALIFFALTTTCYSKVSTPVISEPLTSKNFKIHLSQFSNKCQPILNKLAIALEHYRINMCDSHWSLNFNVKDFLSNDDCYQETLEFYAVASVSFLGQRGMCMETPGFFPRRIDKNIRSEVNLFNELTVLALNLKKTNRLRPLDHDQRLSFSSSKDSIWFKKDNRDRNEVMGAYNCYNQVVYFDPFLPPLDLAATLVHEFQHLARDQRTLFSGVSKSNFLTLLNDNSEYTLLDETFAYLSGAFEQKRFLADNFSRPETALKLLRSRQDLSLFSPTGYIQSYWRSLFHDLRTEADYFEIAPTMYQDYLLAGILRFPRLPDPFSDFRPFAFSDDQVAQQISINDALEFLIKKVEEVYFPDRAESFDVAAITTKAKLLGSSFLTLSSWRESYSPWQVLNSRIGIKSIDLWIAWKDQPFIDSVGKGLLSDGIEPSDRCLSLVEDKMPGFVLEESNTETPYKDGLIPYKDGLIPEKRGVSASLSAGKTDERVYLRPSIRPTKLL